jgi:hypothetical protein
MICTHCSNPLRPATYNYLISLVNLTAPRNACEPRVKTRFFPIACIGEHAGRLTLRGCLGVRISLFLSEPREWYTWVSIQLQSRTTMWTNGSNFLR